MTIASPRYAIYYAPPVHSAFWQAGARWLGHDPAGDTWPRQPRLAGVSPALLDRLTLTPRRYGLHATLRAPFHLAPECGEQELLAHSAAFAATERVLPLAPLEVGMLGDFLALRPQLGATDLHALNAFAQRCVRHFELLRAPLGEAELARRRSAGLSVRQDVLLQRWGYPYTEEEFRFHMTLTDSLSGVDAAAIKVLRAAALDCFAPALITAPPSLAAISVFREDAPGAPFRLLQQFPLQARQTPGHLFFVVGPSGVGKDSLLSWVQEQLPARHGLRFARRTITRPAHPSEDHEPLSEAEFDALLTRDAFAMHWQANGLRYGIRRSELQPLVAGQHVVVNGSRAYLPILQERFAQARVLWIEAAAEEIQRRLASRQREQGAALLQRLERGAALAATEAPVGMHVTRIDNSDPIEIAGRHLLKHLLGNS